MDTKVLTWRNILPKEEREEVSKLEESTTERCEHLRNINGFYYCGFELSEQENQEARKEHPHVYNRLFRRHTKLRTLAVWCMGKNSYTCMVCRDNEHGVRIHPETKMYQKDTKER